MSVALLGSVKRAEGVRGVKDYLKEKLDYTAPTRRAKRSQEACIDAVKRTLAAYLEEQQPFSVTALGRRADVTSSWLYHPARKMLLQEVKKVQASIDQASIDQDSQGKPLQDSPPELNPTIQSDLLGTTIEQVSVEQVAQEWLDEQIRLSKRDLEQLQQQQAELAQQGSEIRRQVNKIKEELTHLYEVRKLTQQEA